MLKDLRKRVLAWYRSKALSESILDRLFAGTLIGLYLSTICLFFLAFGISITGLFIMLIQFSPIMGLIMLTFVTILTFSIALHLKFKVDFLE